MDFYELKDKFGGCDVKVLQQAVEWLDNPPADMTPNEGICGNLADGLKSNVSYRIVSEFSAGWEHHSGDRIAPIAEYVEHAITGTLWEGDQLAMRENLMEYIRKGLTEYLSYYDRYKRGKAQCELANMGNVLKSIVRDRTGICQSVSNAADDLGYLLLGSWVTLYLSEGWEHHTGDAAFPVPCEGMEPEEGYWKHTSEGTMWVGEYGKRREDLLEYMINKAEQL